MKVEVLVSAFSAAGASLKGTKMNKTRSDREDSPVHNAVKHLL
jgi:hypothetical protein